MADHAVAAGKQPASLRTVVAASSAGTAFEWYDFFVFGSLTQVISKTFFSGLPETAGYIAALALFGAGFLFRPLGALVFGRIGDKAGRKGAFLITVVLMGAATFAIGLLPTYAQVGLLAPALLVLMRIIQGFALGGEYGGAAIYVAEHAPADGHAEIELFFTSTSDRLAGEDRFIACQRSVILNADAVQSFSTARFLLKGGTEIAVPARRSAAVRQLYQQYLLDKVRGSKKILS